jgi:hypothetical protein
VEAFPDGGWGPCAAKERPLSSRNRRFRPDPSVAEAEEGWGSGRDRHAPVRAKNSQARVGHALVSRRWWREW